MSLAKNATMIFVSGVHVKGTLQWHMVIIIIGLNANFFLSLMIQNKIIIKNAKNARN